MIQIYLSRKRPQHFAIYGLVTLIKGHSDLKADAKFWIEQNSRCPSYFSAYLPYYIHVQMEFIILFKENLTSLVSAHLRSRVNNFPHLMRFLIEQVMYKTHAPVFCKNNIYLCSLYFPFYQYVFGKCFTCYWHDNCKYLRSHTRKTCF